MADGVTRARERARLSDPMRVQKTDSKARLSLFITMCSHRNSTILTKATLVPSEGSPPTHSDLITFHQASPLKGPTTAQHDHAYDVLPAHQTREDTLKQYGNHRRLQERQGSTTPRSPKSFIHTQKNPDAMKCTHTKREVAFPMKTLLEGHEIRDPSFEWEPRGK